MTAYSSRGPSPAAINIDVALKNKSTAQVEICNKKNFRLELFWIVAPCYCKNPASSLQTVKDQTIYTISRNLLAKDTVQVSESDSSFRRSIFRCMSLCKCWNPAELQLKAPPEIFEVIWHRHKYTDF